MSDTSGNAVKRDPANRPVGRGEVIEATLQAAAQLFADRNPSQVSVREIAAHAGVSHALVHRYLGSKDDIFRATLERDRQEAADFWLGQHGLDETAQTLREDQPPGRYLRTLIRARLDGVKVPPEETVFPHADKMLALIRTHPFENVPAAPFDAGLLFSATMAMLASMSVAEDFYLAQSGLEGSDREKIRAELNRLAARILAMAE